MPLAINCVNVTSDAFPKSRELWQTRAMDFLRKIRLLVPLGLGAALLSAQPAPVTAQPEANAGFQSYLQYVSAKARGQGVGQHAIDSVLSGLSYNPRVVSLDRAQPGATPGSPPAFSSYYLRHIGAERINLGRAALANNAEVLSRIEAQYGVPRQIIVAIWGKETFYGRIKGDFDLPRSLATLAYEGRRRDLFEGELIALMKMVDRGVPRSQLLGSWAGAFGNPQFLPSVYLRVARDGDGDGKADIWNSRADTFASIANYFRDAGWRSGDPWGVRASTPPNLNRALIVNHLASPTCPAVHDRHSAWKTVAEWRALGVIPLAPIADRTMAALFEPNGTGQGIYLLTGNYRIILDYNCSNYYALSVALLADEIGR